MASEPLRQSGRGRREARAVLAVAVLMCCCFVLPGHAGPAADRVAVAAADLLDRLDNPPAPTPAPEFTPDFHTIKFRKLMKDMERTVWGTYPRATLVEIHGLGRDIQVLPFETGNFDKYRFVFSNPVDPAKGGEGGSFLRQVPDAPEERGGAAPVHTIFVDYINGKVHPMVTSPNPWMETSWEPLPHSLGLVEAVDLLLAHGFGTPEKSVTMRKPIYPGSVEACYFFDYKDPTTGAIRFVSVGALSRVVELCRGSSEADARKHSVWLQRNLDSVPWHAVA